MEYKAFDPETKVLGKVMMAFINCMNADDIKPILVEKGLSEIDPQGWYPQQLWLDVLNALGDKDGTAVMYDFVSIGMKVGELAPYPPGYEDASYIEAVSLHDKLYQNSHQGGYPGKYEVEQLGERHVQVTTHLPYPDDMIYGSLYAEAQRFLPEGSHPIVQYDPDHVRRDQGGEKTVFQITW